MIGQTIANEYEIKRVIGKGAFGTVYEARQRSLDRSVAVKVLSKEAAGEKELKRFYAEARHMAALNNPHVVQILWFGEHVGNPCIVMEMLHGQTLKHLLQGPPLPRGRALQIMTGVARGLHAVHSLGIVHRDLSTNNIMVSDTFVKILDLGLAKDLNHMSFGTQEQYIAGTIGYISPEQIESKGITVASDVFAFGVILYETLSGKNPFQAEHYMSVLYNIVHRQPEPLHSLIPDCPAALSGLVERCLQKDPLKRPRNLKEVEAALERIRTSWALRATLPVQSATLQRPQVHSMSSNPYLNRAMIRRREDFFGREQEVKRIYARLNATPPGSMSVVGDRKIGKSSLLNYIYMRSNRNALLEQPDRMIMIFMDLQQDKDMTIADFVQIVQSMAEMELRGRVATGGCSQDLDGIRTLMERLDGSGFKFALLLDGFEVITKNPNFDLEFFSFLRYLANHYNVAYLTSSVRDLQTLCHNKDIADSPFFNIFSTMRLTVFRPEEANKLIEDPSARVGKPLAGYATDLLAMAGRFPFLLQMACSHMLEYAEEREEGNHLDTTEVRQRFYEEARFHYRHMWDGFDSDERSAIQRVASGKNIPDALRHVVEELTGRHYVQMENQHARLFASTFEEFVLKECSGRRSLFSRLFKTSGS